MTGNRGGRRQWLDREDEAENRKADAGDVSAWPHGAAVDGDSYEFLSKDRDPDDVEYNAVRLDHRMRLSYDRERPTRWGRRKLVAFLAGFFVLFGVALVVMCALLHQDVRAQTSEWDRYFSAADVTDSVLGEGAEPVRIRTAVYLEQVRAIDLASSQFELQLRVGYRYTPRQGADGSEEVFDFSQPGVIDFYKGSIESADVLTEREEEGVRYQLVRYDVTVNMDFDTTCFPLERHLLKTFIEAGDTVDNLVLEVDPDASYVNSDLQVTGFSMGRFGVRDWYGGYQSALLDPQQADGGTGAYRSNVLVGLEVQRNGLGVYFECFVALIGTEAWVLLSLWMCTHRNVDPIETVSSAFFGAVSNVMVGANMVPTTLSFGLVVFGNLYGIAFIIAATMLIVSIQHLRQDLNAQAFAFHYGRVITVAFVIVAVVSNVALPLSAWL